MSNKQIVVIEGSVALNATRKWEDKVLVITKKKDDKSYQGGAIFMNVSWNLMTPNDNLMLACFKYYNAPICQSVLDPVEIKKGTGQEYPSIRCVITHRASTLGDLGLFFIWLQKKYAAEIQKLDADKTIMIGKRDISNIVNMFYSEKHKEKPGQLIADPYIALKTDFDRYPAKHPIEALRNLPMTTLLDYNLSKVNPSTNKPVYASLLDEGKPINHDNIHKFIQRDAVVVEGRVIVQSLCLSKSYISMPLLCNKAVIKPPPPAGFSDEMGDMVQPMNSLELNDIKQTGEITPQQVDDILDCM
jgi:hypothetical protein